MEICLSKNCGLISSSLCMTYAAVQPETYTSTPFGRSEISGIRKNKCVCVWERESVYINTANISFYKMDVIKYLAILDLNELCSSFLRLARF